MTNRCRNSLFTLKVERHYTAVVQRQLQRTSTLLFSNKSAYATVDFNCKPVFTGHSFKLQNLLQVIIEFFSIVRQTLINPVDSPVVHNKLRRAAKHVVQ